MAASKRITYAERAAFYEHEFPSTADLAFLESLITARVSSLLEAPCGVGRATVPLARAGLRYVAVDREPAMIAQLERRLAAAGKSAWVQACVGDLRALDVRGPFDLILVPTEGIQMLAREDVPATLAGLGALLSADGTLLLDVATFRATDETGATAAGGPEFPPSYFDPRLPDGVAVQDWTHALAPGARVRRRRTQRRPSPATIAFDFDYDVRDAAHDAAESWRATLELALLSRESIVEWAARANLAVAGLYGGYSRRPFRPDSARMVFLLRRARR